MLAVIADSLSKDYRGHPALRGLELSIAPGEIFALVGPDGAGKSTAIRLLAALLKPSSGRAEVFGFDTARHPEKARSQLGYMAQSFALYPELTVAENLDFFADIYQVESAERERRLLGLMSFSRLGPFKDRLAGRLSGGMKQKLAVSCALIHTPRLLLLDEPTTGVDPLSRRELWKLLFEIWGRGVTVVLATPYLDEAERCGRVALMDRGRVLRCDTPERLKAGLGVEVLELEHPDHRGIREKLAASGTADGLHLFGSRLHLYLKDPTRQRPAVDDLLRGTGAKLRRVEPSLEDVFLNLTGQ